MFRVNSAEFDVLLNLYHDLEERRIKSYIAYRMKNYRSESDNLDRNQNYNEINIHKEILNALIKKDSLSMVGEEFELLWNYNHSAYTANTAVILKSFINVIPKRVVVDGISLSRYLRRQSNCQSKVVVGYESDFISSDIFSKQQRETITTVIVSPGVKQVMSCAFWGCKRMSRIFFSEGIKDCGVDTFRGCNSLRTIVVESDEQLEYMKSILPENVHGFLEVNAYTNNAFYHQSNGLSNS